MVPLNTAGPLVLRFRFRKVGNLQFVSHLDLVRTFSKIVIRAKLPLWYTEGFNPKPKLVFSPPLSIGVESETEYLDLRLTQYVDPQTALEKMNQNVTDEMRFFEAWYPETKLSDIAFLSYDIRVGADGSCEELAKKCEAALLAETVLTEKRGKDKEMKTVDIRPGIRTLTAEAKDGDLWIHAVLCADPSSFLNPELLLRVLKEQGLILGKEDRENPSYSIRRTRAFDKDLQPFR